MPLQQIAPTRFGQVNFNDTGLATAAAATKNITSMMAAKREAEANEAYRLAALSQADKKLSLARDKQAFVEDAPKRAEALRVANLERSAEQGILANRIASGAGGSRFDETIMSPEVRNDPRYQELTGLYGDAVGPMTPERQAATEDFQNQALAQNKRLFSDPAAYKDTVSQKLLETGKFTREQAEAIATTKTTELFPTMDKEVALKLYDKGTAGSDGRAGKQLFSQAGPAGRQEQLDNFYALNEVTDKTASTFRIDPGDYNPTQQNVAKFVSQMGSGPDGVSQDNALQYLQTKMGNTGNVTSGHDIANLSKDDLKAFKVGAQNMRFAKERTIGGTAGTAESERREFNKALIGKLAPDQSTREGRISTLLSGLPSGAPKTIQDATGTNLIDVDGTGDVLGSPQGQGPLLGNTYNQPLVDPEVSILPPISAKETPILNFPEQELTARPERYFGKGFDQAVDFFSGNNINEIKMKNAAGPLIDIIKSGKKPSPTQLKQWRSRMVGLGISEEDYPAEFTEQLK